LNELAREERRRRPELSAEKCFAKVYADPANAAVVRRERRAAMKRLGVTA